MRSKKCTWVVLLSLVAACGDGDRRLQLLEAGDAGASSEKPERRTASRVDPILEGRKYRIQTRNPWFYIDEELATFDVSFDGAPRRTPEEGLPWDLPSTWAAGEITASSLVALSCAYEMAASSDVIAPALEQDLPNPGTRIRGGGGPEFPEDFGRPVPDWPYQPLQLWAFFHEQAEFESSCDPHAYWAQMMNLCVADRYLELANADSPYEMVVKPAPSPKSRLPQEDHPDFRCDDQWFPEEGETDVFGSRRCQAMSITIRPVAELQATLPQRTEALRQFLLWPVSRQAELVDPPLSYFDGFNITVNRLPTRGTLTDAEYLDAILPYYLKPIARFPVQEASDKATLALLAANYYLAAQDLGQWHFECQLGGNTLAANEQWVDTYDHRALRVNELVATQLVDAMRGSVEAAEVAQDWITAAANERTAGNSSEEANQLFWRAKTNSRLECLHAWTDMAPELFQDEQATELDESQLYAVFPWTESSDEVKRVEGLLREAQVNPELILEGPGELANALRASFHEQMPYGFADVDLSGTGLGVLAAMGIAEEDLRSAAYRILDGNRALGRAIVSLDSNTTGVGAERPIEIPGQGPSGYYFVHGTQRSEMPVDPVTLYARSVGRGTSNAIVLPTGDATYAYQGVVNGLVASNRTLQLVSERFGVVTPGGLVPLFPAASTRPTYTTEDMATDAELVGLTQSGISIADQWVPELLSICPDGNVTFFSTDENTEGLTAWRGEAGLECATKGVFGEVPCDPDAFRIEYAELPAPYMTGRDPGAGKFGLEGRLSMTDIEPGDHIYFTRETSRGHEAVLGVTMPSSCNYYSFGGALMQKVNECLAPSSIDPGAPAICCEGLPCDLQVPLEDSLQSTGPRDVESSFMHYLTLARAAATRADDLGEELFRQGLDMDMRAEGAREELEDLCGGVANVDRLTPQTCTTNEQCGDGKIEGMSCMPASGLEGGTRYCTGGSLTDTLRYNSLNDCDDNADCGLDRICVADGAARYCAPACSAGSCSGGCIDSPNGSYCAVSCASDADCGVGKACRESGTGTKVCVASPSDDQRSIEECLNLTEDNALVPAAIGDAPLVAWQFPGLPLCVCRPGATCDEPYDYATGRSRCPVFAEDFANDPSVLTVPMGAAPVHITDTLGFSTGIGDEGPKSPLACTALAELRMPSGASTLEARRALVDQIMIQPWMTYAGYQAVGREVDPEYDPYGFLAINYKKSPWLVTGTAAEGPLEDAVFPNTPWAPANPICANAEAGAGVALQCRSLSGMGSEELTYAQLIRATQIARMFAGGRRTPIAYPFDRERQSEEAVSPNGRYLINDLHRDPAPDWLLSLYPNAYMHKVTVELTNVLAGVHQLGKPLLVDNGSDYKDIEDNTFITSPLCLAGPSPVPAAAQEWMDRIGCGPTNGTYEGWDVLSRYRAFANGELHTGLWARDSSKAGDGVIEDMKKMFGRRSDGSLYYFLNEIATGGDFEEQGVARLLTENWNTREGKVRASEVMDALELVCLISSAPRGPQVGLSVGCNDELMNETASIGGPQDFPKLTARLRCAAERVDDELKRMWVPEIPRSIATAIREASVTDTVPNFRGSYAQTVARLQGAFQTVSESTRTIGSQLRAFANELTLSQSTLEQLDNEGRILDWKLIADISTQIAACGSAASSLSTGAAFACANSAVQIASAVAIESLQEKNLDEDKKQALVQLSMQFNDRLDTIQAAAESLRTAYSDIQSLQAELESTRSQAERAAAKMLFLDSDATGRVYNVNTAMRRNMNTLRARYSDALVDAKRMSFVARRAVEQRLAMNLQDMDKAMSLVEAPSTWVNTACSMTGIDYDRIRDATVTPVSESQEDDFSAGFIGDYVTKLENFVESYRFEYPFRDGSDVAVVSLRDDVLGIKAPCQVEGPNLLYSSADMLATNLEVPGVPAWQDMSDEGTLMSIVAAGGSPRSADHSSPEQSVAPRVPGGSSFSMVGTLTPEDPEARAYWGQELTLEQGLYLLSWYERYGSSDNGCESPPYQSWPGVVGDVISTGQEAVSFVSSAPWMVPLELGEVPNPAEDFIQSCWRRWYLQINVPSEQLVRVRFGLQDDADAVVWGQPQLELVEGRNVGADPELGTPETSAFPKRFFPTTDVLTAGIGECEDTTGEYFQMEWLSGSSLCENICPDGTGASCAQLDSSAFATQCYRELRFEVGPGALERGELIPSIARGNFNYRFSRFGVNLVGTGLRDCEVAEYPSSCYASGYVQYSLRHDGPFTVTNHDGGRSSVALFPAQIEHAKALTAERYITNPIASADRSLMEDFWRSELRGRPMQGSYVLRIYDEPGANGQGVLDMTKLEDVQLIFEYNYWTRSEQ